MHNFREMPLVRMFLVALVVLFACGAVVPGGAFARTWMQNGHEGDPEDGMEIIGGGGGDFEQPGPVKNELSGVPILLAINWVVQPNGVQFPVFSVISLVDEETINYAHACETFMLVVR